MKLIIVIMTTCLMQVSAAGFAQKLTYSKKGATLEQIFTEIRKQTGYYVMYSEDKIDKTTKLDVNFKNTALNDVLDVISKSQDLSYTFDEKNISFKPKEQSFIDRVIARFQAIDVRGKVVDSLGNGLAGATVSVKGFKQSTKTAANGDFYLKNVDEGAVLVVSYLGYVTKEQTASRDFNYVQLQLSTSKLDEVQVIAYGNTTRRLSTGNITTIKAEEIGKQPIDNPLLALQGRVPNLVITPSSGLPGASINLQLRGQNSLGYDLGLTKRSEPLIVVDGVPYQNNMLLYPAERSALAFINPSDIESIDVLADADATSIYGSRGGNGVIIITTKKGRVGDVRVDARLETGFSQVPANRKVPLLNTEQYLEMRREAYKNDNRAIPTNPSQFNNTNFDLTVWDPNRYTDWQDKLLGGNARWQNSSFSISGGSTNLQYLVSGTYRNQGYVYPKDITGVIDPKFETGNLHVSLNGTSANGRLRLAFSNTLSSNSNIVTSTDLTRIAMRLAPNAPDLYLPNGQLNWEPNPYSATKVATWNNPLAKLHDSSKWNNLTIVNNANIQYELAPGLRFITSGAFTTLKGEGLMLNPLSAQDPSTYATTARGSAHHSFTNNNSWTIDPQLSIEKTISSGILTALVGSTYQGQSNSAKDIDASGYKDDARLEDLSAADPMSYIPSSTSSEYKYLGFFGRINYNWKNKYILNLNLRRDGSSRFGENRQYGNYWSLGAAWIFSELGAIKKIKEISFGKLRLSYGSSGNDAIGDYGYLELYTNTTGDGSYQGLRTIKSMGVRNPKYGWEDIRKLESGLDIGLFKDRLLISAAYWSTKSSNQLNQLALPATSGAFSVIVNQDAKIENYGWDFVLNATNFASKNFSWRTSANFGIQKNRLLSLPSTFMSFVYLDRYKSRKEDPIGRPFSGLVFLSEYRGVDPNTGINTFSDQNAQPTTLNHLIFRNAKVIDIQPKTIGLVNNVTAYRFQLTFNISLVKQKGLNYLYNGISITQAGRFDSYGNVGNQPVEVLKRWRQPGDITDIQKFSQRTMLGFENIGSSDKAYIDASYIRLNNVSLSYEIPQSLTGKLKMKSANINASAQNLFTITPYKGADPVIQSIVSMPSLQTFTLGISIGF